LSSSDFQLMIFKTITELSDSDLNQLMSRGKGLSDVGASVDGILENVQKNGDAAILAYALQFDKAELSSLEVTAAEIENAISSLDPKLLQHLRQAATISAVSTKRSCRRKFGMLKTRPELFWDKKRFRFSVSAAMFPAEEQVIRQRF